MPILTPRFSVPRRIGVGSDGIPDYIVATRGHPNAFHPPYGKRLEVYHNGEKLWFVVEADRKRGFAIGLHYEIVDGVDGRVGYRVISHDENGIACHRSYEGTITFKLVPRG